MMIGICTWNNLVAPVFDVSGTILLVQTSPGRKDILGQEDISVCDNPDKIRRLTSMNIELLVCGAVSRLWHDILTACGIQVISYIVGPWDRVLQALDEDRLESPEFRMPGCPPYMQTRNREAINKVAAGKKNMDAAIFS